MDVTMNRQAFLSFPSADCANAPPQVGRNFLPGIETISRRIGWLCHNGTAKLAGVVGQSGPFVRPPSLSSLPIALLTYVRMDQ